MSLKVVEPARPGGGSFVVVNLAQVKSHPAVKTFIRLADDYLGELGYTEHGFRHAKIVARDARKLLKGLAYDKREHERAAIAGYLHDMGNFISRAGHPQSGAAISYHILGELGMPYKEIGIVLGAVGNHEEGIGQPVSPEGAALILADKADVHRSRVRNKDPESFDIHDRVNYAAESSVLSVDAEKRTLTLELRIDTALCKIMEYFEIFLERMAMCRRAAEFLDCQFRLVINGTELL
ncbi:MAG TPA: HD domain-containing protein [Actinomycetota bacterium]|nr:HD domain-containing protein [Actinomycetota bacterium]